MIPETVEITPERRLARMSVMYKVLMKETQTLSPSGARTMAIIELERWWRCIKISFEGEGLKVQEES